MNPVTQKIVDMLDDSRVQQRQAAAVVLGHLRPRDAAVGHKLANCLADSDRGLQMAVLEALAALRPKKIAGQLTPLLESDDDEIRLRTVALLASQGGRAADELARELDHGSRARRREIIKILVHHHTEATFEKLLDLLADPEVGETSMYTLRSEIEHIPDESCQLLRNSLTARLKDKVFMNHPEGAARLLRLLGDLRDPKLIATLLPYVAGKHPVPVRLAAIAALRRPLAACRSLDKPVGALLLQAVDPDPSVARAAIESLRPLQLPDTAEDALLGMVSAPLAEARAFAVRALARYGDGKAIKAVIDCLAADDPVTREAAVSALRSAGGVTTALLRQLPPALDDGPRTELLVRLLLPHAQDITPAARKTLARMTTEAVDKQLAAAPHLVRLVRATKNDDFAKELTERALKHKRAKRDEQALELFQQLDSAGMLDDDTRYAALVCGLGATTSKKDLARATRSTHPVLKHATALVTSGFPLTSRLKREKSLTAEDLFYVGFNFSESKDDDDREFGSSLLTHLAQTSPRSKLGQSAKNKLRLVGWD